MSLSVLPSNIIHKIIDDKVSSSIIVLIFKEVGCDSSVWLFPMDTPESSFRVRSIFSPTKWQLRKLNLHEMLRFWYYSNSLISSLRVRHRKLLWNWEGILLRVLDLLLPFLLVPTWWLLWWIVLVLVWWIVLVLSMFVFWIFCCDFFLHLLRVRGEGLLMIG